jgi:coniferyl-aldehyde dehydrogenase
MNPQPPGNASPQAADLARMESIFARQREAYARSPMPTLAERKRHLAALRALLIDHTDAIAEAISADFTARSVDDTLLGEIIPSVHSIDYSQKRLRRWMKPSPRSVGLNFLPARARVVYQPLGVVGIMVPFNYPVNLAVVPLVAALAAGNRTMIKMSEHTPRTAALMEEMLRKYYEEDHVAVVTGEADIAAAFSKLPFDHLLFTGSIPVGKHVMRAAADNLTPVTLELGGKSPAIIADDIPLEDIIDRLCFAKSLNAGQTCVAPDYVLIPRGKLEPFMQLYKATFRKMFPTINGNPDYTSVVNARSHQRLQDWLKDAAEKGARIEKVSDETIADGTFRMPLHLVTEVTDEMIIMREELFGPILPVVPYDSIEEALAYVKRRPHPLALYLFTYDQTLQDLVTDSTHAGSMCINEAVIQVAVDDLPFGGIGPSGMGHYHGHEGFLTMSKAKSILSKGRLNPMRFMYPPYGGTIQKWMLKWLTH